MDKETKSPQVLINIDVNDLEKGIQFYTQAFDLKVGRRFGDGFVELSGFPSPIYLLLNQAGTASSKFSSDQRRYDRHWTPVHLDIVVDSIESTVNKAKAAGAQMESEVRDRPYGKIAMGADPFGHGFCLIEFSAEGYDALLK